MEIKTSMCSNALRKTALLILKASELGMDVSGYGVADENCMSGNVYLWLEDYQFTLYIGLGSDDIYANWSDPYDGEEFDTETEGKSLFELTEWAEALAAKSEEKEEAA